MLGLSNKVKCQNSSDQIPQYSDSTVGMTIGTFFNKMRFDLVGKGKCNNKSVKS